MMVVARGKVGIPASLMTHSHYLTQCVLAIAGWRGLGLHETRKIQESRGTRNSPNMKIARTLIWWPRAADTLFGGLARIGGERFGRELMLTGVWPPVASDKGKIWEGVLRPFLGGAFEPVSWQGLQRAGGGVARSALS